MQIGGIGKVTESVLKGAFGIITCEEMLQKSSFICALFSHTSAGLWHNVCDLFLVIFNGSEDFMGACDFLRIRIARYQCCFDYLCWIFIFYCPTP